MKEDMWIGVRIKYNLIFLLINLFKPIVKNNNNFIINFFSFIVSL